VADFREGDWLAPEPLEVPLSSSADDTDPWVAHDESFLLFASDRGGDGFDLYVAFRTEFGGWLDPLPLGDAVNTEADETAPSMTHDGNYLLFHREGAGGGDPAGCRSGHHEPRGAVGPRESGVVHHFLDSLLAGTMGAAE
jgi:hypothetical protein